MTLFRQDELQDPWGFYSKMREDSPVYWDEANRLWAIYSYEACKSILSVADAHIPAINPNNRDGLNEYALLMSRQFARLSNGAEHEIARTVGMLLFEKMKAVMVNELTETLLKNSGEEMDWVSAVCKKLPVLVLLESLNFSREDCEFIQGRMEQVVKIMLPVKSIEEVSVINGLSEKLYLMVRRHLSRIIDPSDVEALAERYSIDTDSVISMYTSNLIGLFIQCYDAGRGLLSNSLLHLFRVAPLSDGGLRHKEYVKKSIVETLRFDPPVHNTRREVAGQSILLVLASANRDPQKFDHPDIFDVDRPNNRDHLTFGVGGHQCIARQFSVDLATEALFWLFGKYGQIKLMEEKIDYEPLVNVRLAKKLDIALHGDL